MTVDSDLKRPASLKFARRILFLTEDTSLIRQQLEAQGDERERLESELAQRLAGDDLPLMSNISTDEITPGWVCFYYDETLGQYVYVGMRDGAVKKDEIKNAGFAVVVSGPVERAAAHRVKQPLTQKRPPALNWSSLKASRKSTDRILRISAC